MLRPSSVMFAAPATSSSACTAWKRLSSSPARALDARKSAGRREPERRDRQNGNRACRGVNDLLHATQIPATATFWNRCGEATVELG